MKQNKRKSSKIRWRIFGAILVPAVILILILWLVQTMVLGLFYGSIKTNELKKHTENVLGNLENEDIKDRILILSNDGDINFRIIETEQFKTLYSTGETFNSVTYGWQSFGMFNLYEEAVNNGGEIVRYYSEGEERIKIPERPAERENRVPNFPLDRPESDEEMRHFRERYHPVPGPGFFDNVGRHNDLLYAKITTLSDGTEIMVVADTRISPLDSTVKVLKYQLVFCSLITVVLSLIVSFVIAKHISKPIEKINRSAKQLASGNFDVKFEGKGYREIEELNDTLNFTSSELGKVESLRRELVANVSHDMRTPLTMISGYAEVMKDIPGENSPENIQVIIDEANRLTQFVNSVLDLSKLESGMDNTEFSACDITSLLEDSVERYKKLMSESDITLEFTFDRHVLVMCDVMKITRAVHNLMDNAVNYAKDPKKVTVKQTACDGKVRIEISDNGDGIDPAELPYIWDRYYKTEKSHKRNVLGSGIGLSIVKAIFKLHNARYGVETQKDEGSTFWFELREMDE